MNFLRQRAPRQSLLRGVGIAVAVLLLQAGCGQKGPLYRTDETPPWVSPAGTETSGKKKSQPVLPAPQSQKRDRPPAPPEPPPPSDPAPQPTPDPGQPTPPPPSGN